MNEELMRKSKGLVMKHYIWICSKWVCTVSNDRGKCRNQYDIKYQMDIYNLPHQGEVYSYLEYRSQLKTYD